MGKAAALGALMDLRNCYNKHFGGFSLTKFGGAIITKLYFTLIRGSILLELLGILSGMNFIIVAFFTLFEGLLQAFVFAMLTLTYISIGTQQEGGH